VAGVDRRFFLRWVAWSVGIGLVVLLVHRIGPSSVFAALSRVRFRILWLVAAYLGAQALMALPWWLLLPKSARPSLGAAVRSRLAASGLNALLPLVGAGEVVRVLWLRRAVWTEGLAALVVDRVTFALASAFWVTTGALAAALLPRAPAGLAPAVLVAAIVLAVLAGALIVLGRRGRTLTWVHRRGMKLWNGLAKLSLDEAAVAPRAAALDGSLKRLFRARGPLAVALLLHLVGRGFVVLEMFLALRALDVKVAPGEVLVLAAIPAALAFVAAAIPSQVGVAEGVLAGVAATLGLGASVGLALVLLQRARQLLFVPVTALLLHGRRGASLKVTPRGTGTGAR
jgi:glycosyltransferase 2 family protein